MAMQFLQMVGGCWLAGKAVMAYRKAPGVVQLRAETAGGKVISRVKDVSEEEFAQLKAKWSDETVFGDDARVAQRGLAYLGIEVN